MRRGLWNQLRAAGRTEHANTIKGSRWAPLKNPANQTGNQRTTVASIARTNTPLYRAYLLKEQLRMVFETKGPRGPRCWPDGWPGPDDHDCPSSSPSPKQSPDTDP